MDVETANLKMPTEGMATVPVLISGAPRSGASIVAQALAANGVFLGDRFGRSQNENNTDHLCDQDIVAFHAKLLKVQGGTWRDATSLSGLSALNADFSTSAADLLNKFETHPLWGWKDPRALFFLDAWTRFLPHAHWLFVLRRPTEIAWATVADRLVKNSSRWHMAQETLNLWAAYNQRLLDFVERHPQRSTLLLLPDDLGQGVTALQNCLPASWGDALAEMHLPNIFNSYLMRAEVPRWIRVQARAHRSVRHLWRALQLHRAVGQHPAALMRKRPPSSPGQRRMAVVSQTRMAYSETFVQAHIQGLPAHVDWLLARKAGTVLTNDEIPLCTMWERVRSGMFEAFGTRTEAYSTKAIMRYLKQHHIEAVLAEFGQVSIKVMEACVMQGVPLIAHFHGLDASRRITLEENHEAYQRLFDVAAAVVVVSRDMEKSLEALGASREKIHYNPCSVDLNTFYGAVPGEAPPTFLATGRYVDKKAPHLTLLAFVQVLVVCPEARLIMVGDGALRPVCEDLARTLGIGGAVQFVSFLPHTAIASLMRTMRGFVQHSVTANDGDAEGSPVTVMEAAASGLPIVSTRHAGIKEAVRHGETGFLVAPGDVDAMASHWISLVRNPALAQRLGTAGRAYIQDSPFERTRSLANLWRIIEDAIPPAVN